MIAWIIVIVLLLLLLMLPVGVDGRYGPDGPAFRAKIGPFGVLVYPREPKPQAAEPKKKKRKEKKKTATAGTKLRFEEILDLVRIGLRALGRFGKHLSIDLLRLHLTVADPDPYNAVLRYGVVNAALGALAPLANSVLRLRDSDIRTAIDLEKDKLEMDLHLVATVQIWEILYIAVCAGWALLVWNFRRKKQARAVLETSEQKG